MSIRAHDPAEIRPWPIVAVAKRKFTAAYFTNGHVYTFEAFGNLIRAGIALYLRCYLPKPLGRVQCPRLKCGNSRQFESVIAFPSVN
jgi:hypothetical protein